MCDGHNIYYYRATAVVLQLRGDHPRTLQVATDVFDVTPGSAGLFGEVNFPVSLVLGFEVTSPLFIVPNMAITGQTARVYAVIVSAQ